MRRKQRRRNRGGSSGNHHNNRPQEDQNTQSNKVKLEGGYYKLASGRSDVISSWSRMTPDEKRELITLDEDTVMEYLKKFSPDASSITPPTKEVVSYVQALALHALESTEGVMQIEELSLEMIAIIYALEARLCFPGVKRELHRKAICVLAYFLWISSWPYTSLSVLWFILLSQLESCASIRDSFCSLIEAIFIHGDEPNVIEWQADSYFAALLLLQIGARSDDMIESSQFTVRYILIGVFIAVPFLVNTVERSQFVTGNTADKVALEKIRLAISFAIKILLMYFSWGAYSSLLIVITTFFSGISLSALSIAFMCVAVLGSLVGEVISYCVPVSIQKRFQSALTDPVGFAVILASAYAFSLGLVYYTWDWSAPWGGAIRWVTALMIIRISPLILTTFIAKVLLVILTIPIQAIQFLCVTIWGKLRPHQAGEKYEFDVSGSQ